jgi:hypothetical protein
MSAFHASPGRYSSAKNSSWSAVALRFEDARTNQAEASSLTHRDQFGRQHGFTYTALLA